MSAEAARWAYLAENSIGEVVRGEVEAIDETDARDALRKRNLAPLTLKRRRLRSDFAGADKNQLSDLELARLAARLRDLLVAGVPLAASLKLALSQAQSPREKAWTEDVLRGVNAGQSFTAAINQSAHLSSRLFRVLIEIGEHLGPLGEQLSRLADHYDRKVRLRREIISQLIYPAALSVLLILTLVFLSFMILPQFAAIFAAADSPPPPETRFVLAAGDAIRRHWPIAISAIVALAIIFPILARRYPDSFEKARLSTPFLGKLTLDAAFGSFLRTLSALAGGGAPLARALPLAREAVAVGLVRVELENVETSVRAGERLASALRRNSKCPEDLTHFIEIGEETGDLGRLAGEAALRAELRVAAAITRSMALLGPALTALMGLLTAGVIAAVMSGVLSLNEAVY